MKRKALVLIALCSLGILAWDAQATSFETLPINIMGEGIPHGWEEIELHGSLATLVGPNAIEVGASDDAVYISSNSIGIVIIISFFIGAVLAMQTSYNLINPLIPRYLIGLLTRETMLLEFSSTIVSLILAGKIGSSIASEIGTMRITEQIDALDIMGVNAPNYLILPKIVAVLCFFPLLCMLSMTVGIFGGWVASVTQHLLTSSEYVYGIRYAFNSYYIVYSIIKIEVFAFIIATVASYHGFFVSGGSLEVGRSSTRAVVHSSIIILMFNLLLTKLLL